jgi:purine-nucleoside phosphorylase
MPGLQKQYTNVMSGQITSNSIFYQDDLDWYKQLVRYGVLAVDMETYQMYLIANKFRKKALTVNLVSDLVYDLSHFPISDEDKETAFIMLVTNILDSIYVKHFS